MSKKKKQFFKPILQFICILTVGALIVIGTAWLTNKMENSKLQIDAKPDIMDKINEMDDKINALETFDGHIEYILDLEQCGNVHIWSNRLDDIDGQPKSLNMVDMRYMKTWCE